MPSKLFKIIFKNLETPYIKTLALYPHLR